MSYLPNFIKKLIEEFDKFPSIGPKTASRLIFNLLHRKDDIKILSDALNEAYEKIHFCPQCFNLTDEGLCNICNDIKRDKKNICIVSNNQDVEAVEKKFHLSI